MLAFPLDDTDWEQPADFSRLFEASWQFESPSGAVLECPMCKMVHYSENCPRNILAQLKLDSGREKNIYICMYHISSWRSLL